jgi:cytochrome c biogenesis factor
MDREDW